MAEIETPPAFSKPTSQVTFYEFHEPPLDAGDYTVTVTQSIAVTATENPANENYTADLSFAVLGPHFHLPPPSIRTFFPPADAQGEYSNVLPHVIFRRKTLPWQRSPEAETTANGKVYPWLMILTFDENDPIPAVQTGTLADFRSPLPTGVLSYPNLSLEWGEEWADPCQYIDIPAALFYKIAPTMEDARWLAHTRTIDLELASNKTIDGHEFSAVVSNRLPTPGMKTQCCLVSIEGMAASLPVKHPDTPATGVSTVRLAVLASWQFGVTETPVTFSDYFSALNNAYTAPITPQISYDNLTGTANADVAAALGLGYTAFNHATREGAATVSWYRGPFLPYSPADDQALPASSADALVRYDPATGMFDESLASAWQLGQMLALNDKNFATALYTWKRRQTQDAVVQFETNFLAGSVGVMPSKLSEPGTPKLTEMMDALVKPLLLRYMEKADTEDTQATGATALTATKEFREGLNAAVLSGAKAEGAQFETIVTWLAGLRLLNGVPFWYLIPDERLLPFESIRFFEIDERWINCLIDGAFSLGRSTTNDVKRDATVFDELLQAVASKAKELRQQTSRGHTAQLRFAPPTISTCGILLRSEAVTTWPGMEVYGFREDRPVRKIWFEAVSPQILLCLFEGSVDRVVFSEPVEIIHFGLDLPSESDPIYRKTLKYIDGGDSDQPAGTQMSVTVIPTVTSDRVIDISGMAASIQTSLVANGGMRSSTVYSPAEFALELVEGAQQVTFNLKGNA